jgi:hypothetical protein
MRLSTQKLVATCSRDFDFKLDDWNQMHFGRHIWLAISTTSCLFLKFKSVLERMHSGLCDRLLRIHLRYLLATSVFKLDDWNQMHFGQHFVVSLQQRQQHM